MAKLELKMARAVMAFVKADYDEKSPTCCWCQLVPRDHPICARRTPEGKDRIHRLLQDAASECSFLHKKIGHLLLRSSQPGVSQERAICLEETADYEDLHIECIRKEMERLEKLMSI